MTELSAAQALAIAQEHERAGRAQQAAGVCEQALALEAIDPGTLNSLAVVATQCGRGDLAAGLLERAIALDPSEPAYFFNLAQIHGGAGRLEEAGRCCRQALALGLEDPIALNSAGMTLAELGSPGEAEQCYRRALARGPDLAQVHSNLANALTALGRAQEAAQSARRALELDPELAAAYNNLGDALCALGEHAEAERCFRHALELEPGLAEAWNNLGNALRSLGCGEEAESCYRRALELKPRFAAAYCNLADALRELGRFAEALQCCREALSLAPGLALAHASLGNALKALGKLEQAALSYREAVAREPRFAEAHGNLGGVLMELGRLDEAESSIRRALELKPDFADAHCNLIFLLDLHERASVEEQQAERRRWYLAHGRRHAQAIRAHDNVRDPERRLKVGYVSADFRRHSSYYGFGPVILGIDRAAFEVFCYSGVRHEDEVTARLRAGVAGWRDTIGMSDDALAAQIRADRIDLLVDPAGHSAGNRLLVFARRPAPVQITHGTGTGLETMDYLLADPILVPEDDRKHYAERVVDLPCCMCYEPPPYLPPVSPLPALAGRPFTFGCLNRLEKITDPTISAWARIFEALPQARLLVKSTALDDPRARAEFLGRLEAAGLARARVELRGTSAHEEHLKCFQEIDLVLDPFPHGGGIATAEALAMGVPAVTLLGATPASRVSAALQSVAGVRDWIARGPDEYVGIAVRAPGDLARLAETRGSLRARTLASALGNTRLYCRAVESTYRRLWRVWCDSG